MKTEAKKQTVLSREKWLQLALETMLQEGISKFSLDALLKAMPVSKGSFYWHFKNRAEFLAALVEFWDRKNTQSVVEALAAQPESADAGDKLWELMCEVYEMKQTRSDLLIRSLTLEFPALRSAVAAVDQKRYNTVRQLFAEMGFEGDALDVRAHTFVAVTSMDQFLLLDLSDEVHQRLLKLRYEFFVRP